MAFRFTLAQVLRVRETIERREELALQNAELEVARARKRIEELTQIMTNAAKMREQALKQSVQAFELRCIDEEINAAMRARQAMIVTLQALMKKRDEQRAVYQQAHNGRQMLSEMETRQRNEYDQEQARAEQKKLDDIFAARIQRNSKLGE